MAAASDLLGVGQHCAVPDCSMLDFLPFKCECCRQTFCLEHRTYEAHQCKHSSGKTLEVIVCPLCAKGVHLKAADDPNMVFQRHTQTDCDPSNYNKVNRKPRCPAPGCKEKLTTINTYVCKSCKQRVCLKHRFETDHKCPAAAGASMQHASASSAVATASAAMAAAAAANRMLSHKVAGTLFPVGLGASSNVSKTHAPSLNSSHQQQTRAAPDAAVTSASLVSPSKVLVLAQDDGSVRGTGEGRRQMLELDNCQPVSHVTPPRLMTAATAAPALGDSSGVQEQCPQCGAGFGSVVELITHVDAMHSATQNVQHQPQLTSVAAFASREQFECPSCNAAFEDAVLLVAHHQQCPSGLHQQQRNGNHSPHTTCTVS